MDDKSMKKATKTIEKIKRTKEYKQLQKAWEEPKKREAMIRATEPFWRYMLSMIENKK